MLVSNRGNEIPPSYMYTVQFDFHISGYFVYLCPLTPPLYLLWYAFLAAITMTVTIVTLGSNAVDPHLSKLIGTGPFTDKRNIRIYESQTVPYTCS